MKGIMKAASELMVGDMFASSKRSAKHGINMQVYKKETHDGRVLITWRGGQTAREVNAWFPGDVTVYVIEHEFRSGDTVRHFPTNEHWQLACADSKRGDVYPCGWPPTVAKASDCVLMSAATDAESKKMVDEWLGNVDGYKGPNDFRVTRCREIQRATEVKGAELPQASVEPATMITTTEPTWSYSHDEESYHGGFASMMEAAAEGFQEQPYYGGLSSVVWVGECEPPPSPELAFDASDWLERVDEQEEYNNEHAYGWNTSTKEQRQELEADVRAVMAAWLDRHNLRPKFFNVNNPINITREEYEAKLLKGGVSNG